MILSGILLIAFFIIYLTQSTKTADRIYLYMRIERGQLSSLDIVNISRRQWKSNMYSSLWWVYRRPYAALRLNLSKTNRIYQTVITNGHKSSRFISRQDALSLVQNDNRRQKHDLYCLVNPKSVNPLFYNLAIRSEAI